MPPELLQLQSVSAAAETVTRDISADLTAVLRELIAEMRRARGALPELLSGPAAAVLCSIGRSTWARLTAAGKTPAPVRLSGATRWRRSELLGWIAAGCPDRRAWEA